MLPLRFSVLIGARSPPFQNAYIQKFSIFNWYIRIEEKPTNSLDFGRYLPFVAEVEIRELDFAYAVAVMLVPRLRTDQALVYTISVNPLPPMQVCVTKNGGILNRVFLSSYLPF